MENTEQPIIKKKKKAAHHGHHGGAWKVAYADFVTAMMAFFLVMWILGLSDATKKGVAQFFTEPGAFSFLQGKALPVAIDNVKPTAGQGKEDGKKSGGKDAYKLTDSMRKAIVVEKIQDSARIKSLEKSVKDQIQELAKKDQNLSKLISSLNVQITQEGLRIELVENEESVFFEVGSARLNKQAITLLQQLGAEVGKIPNFVEIEGHTDTRGYGKNTGYGNWELSADRANSARRVMESNGLWEGQVIGVKGYADRKLRTPENPFDISNRRVTILVRYKSDNEILPR
ncbi:MAG: flagellar motor protein MotB [Candidatus Kapaibacterium sp.]|jgi:chemotaxis protein MotB